LANAAALALAFHALDFVSTSADRRAAQPRDFTDAFNTTPAALPSQQTGKVPPTFFIQ